MRIRKLTLRRVTAIMLAFMLLVANTMLTYAANFDGNYSLSGTSADKMVSIATAQVGSSQSKMGYSDPWCARFVSDVAAIAGEKSAIPYNAGCRQLYNAIIKAGGKDVSSPQKGDIVFFVCINPACKVSGYNDSYSHVGIIINSNKVCISGNYGNKVARHSVNSYCGEPHSVSDGNIILKYVRPNYKNSTSNSTSNKPQYFNCNMQISCINGKTVNLYNNPGDNSRVDYFDRGPSMTSNYGAKLSDGSTWYRITADSSGTIRNFWLKYESSKMTVKDLSESTVTPQTKPTTLSADVANVTLDLSTKTNQTIKLTLGGDLPNNCKLDKSISNSNIVSSEWVNYTSGTIVNVRISGKDVGTATITYKVLDGNTQKVYAEKKVAVTVKEPSYTVKYDANGGSGAPSTQTKTYQKPLSLSSVQPTRSGYTFSGWATSPTDSVQYRPGVQYMTDKDVTLYAVWTPVEVSISFDKTSYTVKQGEQLKINFTFTGNISGGNYSVEQENVCKVIDQGVELNQHYGFVTCETLAPGKTNVTLSLCDENNNVLTSKSVPVTVEAVAPATYTIKYNANGGTGAPSNQIKTYQKSLSLSSIQPTRSGYTFSGWATSPNGSVQYRPGEQYSKDQDVTLYAIWDVVSSKFSVSVSCNNYFPNNPDIMNVVRQSDTEYTCYLNYDKADDEIPAIFYLAATIDGDKADTRFTWTTDYSRLLYPVPDSSNSSTARAIVYPNRSFGDVKITVTATNENGQTDSASIVFHIRELETAKVIPSNAVEFNGHYYCYYDDSMTWLEAKDACERMGGHLASITTADESKFILNMIQSGKKYYYWLGGTDDAQEGSWKWITGESWSFENWIVGQPDNHSDSNGNSENYLAVERIKQGWNDVQNSGDPSGNCKLQNAGYVCEWS